MLNEEFEFGAHKEATDNGFMTSPNYLCTATNLDILGCDSIFKRLSFMEFFVYINYIYSSELQMTCRFLEKSVRVVGVY